MKKRLYNYSRLLILGIVLLYSENVFCANDKPTHEDSVAFYQFWQQADLYILQKINENFNNSLNKKLKEDLQTKIKNLSDDKDFYLTSAKETNSKLITDNYKTDYVGIIKKNIMKLNKGSLYNFIQSLVNIKAKYRGVEATGESKHLLNSLDDFKADINKEIATYVYENTSNREQENNELNKDKSTNENNNDAGNQENNEEQKDSTPTGGESSNNEQVNKNERVNVQTSTPRTDIADNNFNLSDNAAIVSDNRIYFMAGLLFISVVVLLFLFFVFRRNVNNRFDQLSGELVALKSTISRQLDAKDEEWRRRNNELQNSISNRLNDTKRDLDDLYQHVQQYQVQNQFRRMPDRQAVGTPLAPPPPAQNYKTYYLPSPDPQGFFWNDKKTTIPDGGTFYELKVEDDNPNIGQFSFYTKSEKNVKTALSNPDMYIKPVCKSIDGIYSGSSIEVKSPGKLQFMGEKWILANGAKVTIIVV
ncbi:MAG: hypothetical protein RBR87_16265 [Bacteroidales bacterium]|jgi:hypothetical protein|nr:hypothetical protein [Bacteroidales bacterium]